jgi:hypothetical protein
MIDRLRSSAELWRNLAGAALVFEVLGVVVFVGAAVWSDAIDIGWAIGFGMVVTLFTVLGYGLFIMMSRMLEGLAELIGQGPPAPPPFDMAAWAPSHWTPASGLAAWKQPDATLEPSTHLSARVQLRLVETLGLWAKVMGSNGSFGWVDSRLLVPVSVTPSPKPGQASEPPAGPGSVAVGTAGPRSSE